MTDPGSGDHVSGETGNGNNNDRSSRDVGDRATRSDLIGRYVTVLLLCAPPLSAAVMLLVGQGPTIRSAITGLLIGWVSLHGIAIGYHRYLTHRSFVAGPRTRAVLTLLGATAVQGGPISWVATHRVHHRSTEKPGDPHSPGAGKATFRGLLHAHVGWLLDPPRIDAAAVCPDLTGDRDIRRIDRIWPLVAVLSVLVLPFLIGWVGNGTTGAINTMIWGGVVRMGVVHHLTWSVNSIAHTWGKRPFPTKDGSRNVAVLAPFTCGEGWHNAHHAYPRMARHGMLPGQIDTAARVIRTLEMLGLVHEVRWPDREKMARTATGTTQTQAERAA
jgi:stearoyl-CoA desaturase (delta-9 desaturase)